MPLRGAVISSLAIMMDGGETDANGGQREVTPEVLPVCNKPRFLAVDICMHYIYIYIVHVLCVYEYCAFILIWSDSLV